MQTAKKIIKALSGKKLNYVNAEKAANDLGYSIVFFNTALGDAEIERYNLQSKTSLKAFTYCKAAKIIFIDGTLHSDDRLYLLLHEIGHIALGHIGDGRLMTRNQILIEFEADNFAYTVIHGERKTSLYALLSAIILCLSMLFFTTNTGTDNNKNITAPLEEAQPTATQVVEQIDEQPETETDVVYVTDYGKKFHLRDCMYIKDKTITELPRSKASSHYAPCKVCKP